LHDKVAELAVDQYIKLGVHRFNKFLLLLTVGHYYTFLDDLVPVAVEGETFKVLEHNRVNMLLSLCGVEELHSLFYHVIPSNVHHHFNCLVALFEGFFEDLFSAFSDFGSLYTLLQKNLKCSSSVRVDSNFEEVILYCV